MRRNGPTVFGFKDREEAKECGQPLDARKNEETNSPLHPPEGNAALPMP